MKIYKSFKQASNDCHLHEKSPLNERCVQYCELDRRQETCCIDKLLKKTNQNNMKLIKNIINCQSKNTHTRTHNVVQNEDPKSLDSSMDGHFLAKTWFRV